MNTVFILLSLILYATAVAKPIREWVVMADRNGYVDAHALQYLWIAFSGMIAGIVIGPRHAKLAHMAVKNLLPRHSESSQNVYVLRVALIVIVISMLVGVLWTIPELSYFVDRHTGLLLEVDLLVYVMGIINGFSWYVLLRCRAWFGLILTPAMMLMTIVGVLAKQSW